MVSPSSPASELPRGGGKGRSCLEKGGVCNIVKKRVGQSRRHEIIGSLFLSDISTGDFQKKEESGKVEKNFLYLGTLSLMMLVFTSE